MEKGKLSKKKSECICTEEDNNKEIRDTESESTFIAEASHVIDIDGSPKFIATTKVVSFVNRAKWVDEELQGEIKNLANCICELDNEQPNQSTAAEDQNKKAKSNFVTKFKNLMSCACADSKAESPVETEKEKNNISMVGREYKLGKSVESEDKRLKKTEPLHKSTSTSDEPQKPSGKKLAKIKDQGSSKDISEFESVDSNELYKLLCICRTDKELNLSSGHNSQLESLQSSTTQNAQKNYVNQDECVCGFIKGQDSKQIKKQPLLSKTSSEQASASKPKQCVCHLKPKKGSNIDEDSSFELASKPSKPRYYPRKMNDKSEELIRKINYQRTSQYSYTKYDPQIQRLEQDKIGYEPSSSYSSTSGQSSRVSSQYMIEDVEILDDDSNDDDLSQTYSDSKESNVSIKPPSCYTIESTVISSTTSASEPIYQQSVQRSWQQRSPIKLFYDEPLDTEIPARTGNIPSRSYRLKELPRTNLVNERPLKYAKESLQKKEMPKQTKDCICPFRRSVPTVSATAYKKEQPKTRVETPKPCTCPMKPTKSDSKQVNNTIPSKSFKTQFSTNSSRFNQEPSKTKTDKLLLCNCLEKLPSKLPVKLSVQDKPLAEATSTESKPTETPNVASTAGSSKTTNVTDVKEVTSTLKVPSEHRVDKAKSESTSKTLVQTVIPEPTLKVPSIIATNDDNIVLVDGKKSTDIEKPAKSTHGTSTVAGTPTTSSNPPATEGESGWWNRSRNYIIGSTVVAGAATAIGAYQLFRD